VINKNENGIGDLGEVKETFNDMLEFYNRSPANHIGYETNED